MQVSVIAGPSNVGKSTAAKALGEIRGARLLEVDDLARSSTSKALAFERDPSVWDQSPTSLCELLIGKGIALWPEIASWIDGSIIDTDQPTIIEGEGPSPGHLRAYQGADVAAVFVIEPDARRLHDTLSERSQSYRKLPPLQQANVVQMNVLYGEWLRHECDRQGIPWIESQPWATLLTRCTEALLESKEPGRVTAMRTLD